MQIKRISGYDNAMLEDAISRKLDYEDEFKNKGYSFSSVKQCYGEYLNKMTQSAFSAYQESVLNAVSLSHQFGDEYSTKYDIMAWDACRIYDAMVNNIDFTISKGHLLIGESEPEIYPIEDDEEKELPKIEDQYNL